MTKKSYLKLKVAFTSILLALVFALSFTLSIFSTKANADTRTVCEDNEYYSETTYFLTESAYNKHLKKIGAEETLKKNEQFVLSASKKVCVQETTDEQGKVIDSHPLKKAELEQLAQKRSAETDNGDSDTPNGPAKIPKNIYDQIIITDGGGAYYETLKSKSSDQYFLTIEFVIGQDTLTKEYRLAGKSVWQSITEFDTKKVPESSAFDYVGITWGGNGNLVSENYFTHGIYSNNSDMHISTKLDNPERGYVWQFQEKLNGYPMNYGTFYAYVNSVNKEFTNTTTANMTYIHTYNETTGTVSFNIGTDGASLGLSFSATKDYWDIQVGLYGLQY